MCRGFESGGAGLGISKFYFSISHYKFIRNKYKNFNVFHFFFCLKIAGVQKPGGDQGIDPNALKSLVG